MTRKVRVMIVDDESHIRRFMHSIVNSVSGVEVIGEADNGESAILDFHTLQPDVVLLDINMPKKNGIEVLEEIKAIKKDTSVIMLTSLSSIEMVKKSVALHAANYVLKDNSPEKIREVIKQVCFERISAAAEG